MGASQSTISTVPGVNKESIKATMLTLKSKWDGIGPIEGRSQTELFKKIMSTKQEDFKGFDNYHLGEVFTDRTKCFPDIKYGNFNNAFLFRDSQTGIVHIPLRSDGKFTSMTPLGFPGRDLPQEWGLNVSHFMTVKHKDFKAEDSGAWTFNAMLPVTHEELEDFKEKVAFSEAVVTSLRENTSIKDCGQKVLDVASRLGLPDDTPIRDYMAKAIVGLPIEVKTGKPGFTLHDSEGQDISSDVEAVKSMIYEVFSDSNALLLNSVQPPHKNSQTVSHLHTMFVRELTESLGESYFDAQTIIQVHQEIIADTVVLDQSEEEDDSLTRVATVVS